MDKVAVLMSSFNGEKYISQQLNSILNQRSVEVTIFVRDDGSTDKTREILGRYSKNSNINVSFESNIGWRKSFFSLIIAAQADNYDYFALSDQDDIWSMEKLKRAVDKIKLTNSTLYYSNAEMIDDTYKSFGKKLDDDYRAPVNPRTGYFDGNATGATMVFSSYFLKKIQKNLVQGNEENAHDAFLFAASNFVGRTVYDEESFILYRRNSNNATGFGSEANQFNPTLIDRYKKFKKGTVHPYSDRATLLLQTIGDELSVEDRNFLKQISTAKKFSSRIRLLFNPKIKSAGLLGVIKIKLRILQNRF